jgi:hypothetical protein
LNAKFSKCEF